MLALKFPYNIKTEHTRYTEEFSTAACSSKKFQSSSSERSIQQKQRSSNIPQQNTILRTVCLLPGLM
jgi:hypothetical protein